MFNQNIASLRVVLGGWGQNGLAAVPPDGLTALGPVLAAVGEVLVLVGRDDVAAALVLGSDEASGPVMPTTNVAAGGDVHGDAVEGVGCRRREGVTDGDLVVRGGLGGRH